MSIGIGDKVRYLNDVGGGIVSKIISNIMVEIIDESGFNIPVLKSELVIVEQKQNESTVVTNDTLNIQDAFDEVITVEGNDVPHFFLAFVPLTNKKDVFDFYFINDSNYFAQIVCAEQNNNEMIFVNQQVIEPNIKVHIKRYSFEELHTISIFNFQLVLFKEQHYSYVEPIEITYKIPHINLHKHGAFKVNDFFEDNAYVVAVYNYNQKKYVEEFTNEDIEKVKKLEDHSSLGKVVKIKKTSKQNAREVDLHIHELIEDESGLSAADKLRIQLQEFESQLSHAIQEGIEKIVFIHGVGNGVLKSKISEVLRKDYPQLFFQDASFQKYKFGATLIYLRKV